jgi:DNA repair protein RecO (recombination protein O)
MIYKTRGIVLHRYKYSDSKIISNIYTEKFGLKTYIIFGNTGKKSKMQINLLQPLAILDLNVYNKETGEIQKIKELSINYPFTSMYSDIKKSTLSFFIAEFLLKTLKEQEPDPSLFEFLFRSFIKLEEDQNKISNFHILFLTELCHYLGIHPDKNYSSTNKIFDLQSGRFVLGNPFHDNFLNEKQSEQFNIILNHSTMYSYKLDLNLEERRFYLQTLLQYYQIHLERPGKLKTLQIISDIFS